MIQNSNLSVSYYETPFLYYDVIAAKWFCQDFFCFCISFLTLNSVSYYETYMIEASTKMNTIGKAVAIFESINAANKSLSIKELAETLNFNKSSIHHHLKTLTQLGYLQQNKETKKYDIGLGLVRIGQSYLQRLDVRERGHYYIEQLSRKISETVHMLILDNNEVVYIDKVDVNHQPGALKCTSFIGLRTDIYSTAAGKTHISHLEKGALNIILDTLEMKKITPHTIDNRVQLEEELIRTKERGYALDLEEHHLGLQCIAVPVMNMHSQCVAAISVSSSVSTISREDLEGEILSALRETGKQISAAMGYI